MSRRTHKGERIQWIDIAKGLASIIVIIGHTITIPAQRGLIFSFHMALFFLLSGYTMKLPLSLHDWFQRVARSARQLLMPWLFAWIIRLLSEYKQSTSFTQYIQEYLRMLLWSSGVRIRKYNIPALGACWFLVVLFEARTVFSFYALFVRNPIFLNIIAVGLCYAGNTIAQTTWLYFCFDIALSIQPFLVIAYTFQQYVNRIESSKNKRVTRSVMIVSGLTWIIGYKIVLNSTGTYLEFTHRRYPKFPLCFMAAVAGSVFVMMISTQLADIRLVSTMLTELGSHSLTIFLIHTFDNFVSSLWTGMQNDVIRAVLRVLIDLILFAFSMIIIW